MKTYSFLFPLTQRVSRNRRLATEHMGDLLVTFYGKPRKGATRQDELNEQFKIEISNVTFNNTEIPFEVLVFSGLMEQLEDAAYNHIASCHYGHEEIPAEDTRKPIEFILVSKQSA